MKKISFAILALMLCVAFVGCAKEEEQIAPSATPTPAVTATEAPEEEPTEKPAEKPTEKPTEEPASTPSPEKEEPMEIPQDASARDVLREYARTHDTLYVEERDYTHTYTDVRYKLTDMQYDGVPELIAVGMDEEGALGYVRVFVYVNNKISVVFDGACGAANGGFCYPIVYRGQPYLLAESISSSNGFNQFLYQYGGAGEECDMIHSSLQIFPNDWKGRETGFLVDDTYVSEDEFKAYRQEIENGYMNPDDFVKGEDM